jgi:hypothetical protein
MRDTKQLDSFSRGDLACSGGVFDLLWMQGPLLLRRYCRISRHPANGPNPPPRLQRRFGVQPDCLIFAANEK